MPVYRFCMTALRWMVIVAVGLVFVLNVVFTADVAMNASERVTVRVSLLEGLAGVAVAALLVAAVRWLKPRWQVSERRLFLACAGIYGVAALYLILNVDGSIRADALWTFEAAAAYGGVDGCDALLPGGYLFMYPHQLGLMTLDRLLQGFCPAPKVFFVLNFLMVLGLNFTLFQTAEQLFHRPAVTRATILLSFAFLPPLFFVLFAYGLLPGLCAMSAALYAALRFENTGRWRFLVLAVGLGGLATVLKQNFLIGMVAMVLYFGLRWLRDRTWRRAAAVVAAAVCLVLPSRLLIAGYERANGLSLQEGAPAVLWVAMGTDLDNTERAPGWYNEYNYATYVQSADAQQAALKGRDKLQENLAAIRREPGRAASFFITKLISQWCEPMLQSDWSGPLADCGQAVRTPLLQDFYAGGVSNMLVSGWTKLITVAIWGLTLVFMLAYAAKTPGWEMALMHFVGGLLFHTVWEGKSQYILPYVVLVIPFAAFALCRLADRVTKIRA